MHDYKVKNVKSFRGHEWDGYNVTLYRGKKKIAFVVDQGDGGCPYYEWEDKAEEQKILEFVKTLPPTDFKLEMDLDLFMGQLVDDFKNNKRFKRLSKTETLFRLKGDKEGTWRVAKTPYSSVVEDQIRLKYMGKIETVYNPEIGFTHG